MQTLLLTSTEFTGEVEFRYCPEGYLLYFENRAELDPHQRAWLLANLPGHVNALHKIKDKSKTLTLTQVKKEITFDDFWHRYDHKAVSSKKKALAAWNRLSKANQLKAHWYIGRYFNSIPQGVAKKYAETYLNSEMWNN
jgi:hypothetical protein